MSRNWIPVFPAAKTCTRTLASIFGLLLVPALALAAPCVLPDNGGTVVLPPAGCGYLSPADVHVLINGLPPGDTLKIGIEHQKFFNVQNTPGGPLGGETEHFNSIVILTISGTGSLSGFHRSLSMQAQCQTNTAPRTIGATVQSFDTDMYGIQGQLPPGDPDFDLLRISAGSGFGMPSPGHTTLTKLPSGNWNVDSFFDISYRIDFIGHAGTLLGGHSGSTTGTIRMGSGEPAATQTPCVVAANADGSVDLPPAGCGYVSPNDFHMMSDGLPTGTVIHMAADHARFFNVVRDSGSGVPGENEHFGSTLTMVMDGTGQLQQFHKTVNIQAQCLSHTDPRVPGANIQSFDTEMIGIQGQLPPGDPDFDLLRITAGSGFGMPSPGHTTLTGIPSPAPINGDSRTSYNVDSFFDISYRIDFIGAATGPLAGMSGSTTGTIRMEAGSPTTVGVPDQLPSANSVELVNSPNPSFNPGTTIRYRLPSAADVQLAVYDVTGKKVRSLLDERVPAGPHAMLWDGLSDAGHRLGSGNYFIKLSVNGKILATKKATLVR